jgi:hypothetical protein
MQGAVDGGNRYELAKIRGHSTVKMTERYSKLARQPIAKTGSTARMMWRLMQKEARAEDGSNPPPNTRRCTGGIQVEKRALADLRQTAARALSVTVHPE